VVKRLGREADHSPPASAEVKKMWICTSAPSYAFMAYYLHNYTHRDNFTLPFVYLCIVACLTGQMATFLLQELISVFFEEDQLVIAVYVR
jgi:hypothetical protein